MGTLTFPLQKDTPASRPLRTGIALSVTVAVFYALCTLVWLVAPEPFLGFINNLFHGSDFTPLLKVTTFSWGSFAQALLVMAVWAFLAGAFFGWLRQRLGA